MEALLTADAVDRVVNELGRAHSAAVANEIISSLADALSINPVLISVAVTHTLAQRLDVSSVTETLLSDVVEGRVKSAFSAETVAHLKVLGQAHTLSGANVEDAISVTGDSANTETLVVDLVPLTLRADSFNGVVASDAAALAVGEDLVDAASDNTVVASVGVAFRALAHLLNRIVGGVSGAGRAHSADVEGVAGTVAALKVNVVDFIVGARNAAHLKGGIKELASRALDALSAYQVEADLADAALVNEVLVRSAGRGWHWKGYLGKRSIGFRNAATIVELIALDAVAG